MLEYQKLKIFLQKITIQIDLETFLWLKKVKNTVPWTNNLNGEEVVGTIYKNELQNTNQKEFRIEKVIKKVINYMLNGKIMIICVIVR